MPFKSIFASHVSLTEVKMFEREWKGSDNTCMLVNFGKCFLNLILALQYVQIHLDNCSLTVMYYIISLSASCMKSHYLIACCKCM